MKRKTFIAVVAAVLIVLTAGSAFATGQIAKNYAISTENAANFALVDAGVLPEEAEVTEVEFSFERGKFIYEVEFFANGIEYEYKIDSNSGVVIDKQSKAVPGYVPQATPAQATQPNTNSTSNIPNTIGVDKAKAAAFADAGVTEADIVVSKAKIDREDGKLVYDIEFYIEGKAAYEYEIDAYTGTIIEKGYESLVKPVSQVQTPAATPQAQAPVATEAPKTQTPTATEAPKTQTPAATEIPKTQTPAATEVPKTQAPAAETPATETPAAPQAPATPEPIGVDKAVAIALGRAGLTANQVVFEKTALDRDDGRLIYEIEFFIRGQKEYDVEVDAYTGQILDFDVENWDD